MTAFDIHKNLIAVLGALTLALMMSVAPSAHATDTTISTQELSVSEGAAETYDFIFGDGDTSELRRLLSAPALSEEERHQLHRSLNRVDEELADASPTQPSTNTSKGIVRTVNDLLGVPTPNGRLSSS